MVGAGALLVPPRFPYTPQIRKGNIMTPLLMGMIGGVLSWFATNFLGNPLAEFYRLRRQIQASLVYYANVPPVVGVGGDPREHPSWEYYREASDTFRRHATNIGSLAVSHPLINRVLSIRGYRLELAASGLIGYSNTLGDREARSSGEVASNRGDIEKGLRLSQSAPVGLPRRARG